MNFLAHFYLSSHNEALLAGNFVADWIKGSAWKKFPDDIGRGILHHRFIDSFTDDHSVTREMTVRLRPAQGKFAGVVSDIVYDHFLAAGFEHFSSEPLKNFSSRIYSILNNYRNYFPEPALFALDHMEKHDWLSGYAHHKGIRRALNGLSGRVPYPNNLHKAHHQIRENEEFLRVCFYRFFPDLQRSSETWLREVT